MSVLDFVRLSREEFMARLDPSDPYKLCPVRDEEGLRAHIDELRDFHIDYLLSAYSSAGILPPLDFLRHFLRRESLTARQYALQALTWLDSVPADLLDEVKDIAMRSASDTERGLAIQALGHFAKRRLGE